MKTEYKQLITNELKRYGAFLDEENCICTSEVITPVQIKVKGKRIRFELFEDLIMSGPIEAKTVAHFLESFWHWTPTEAPA